MARADRPPVAPLPRALLAASMLASLAACSVFHRDDDGTGSSRAPGDNAPTLRALASRHVTVDKDTGVPANEEQAIAAYRSVLDASPDPKQRAEALRRLGDLSMDSADTRFANGQGTAPDYKAAVQRYREYLQKYPDDPANDQVQYQLARAYEQSGDLELALKTLDDLVRKWPKTRYLDEANFRRGELLFTMRQYPAAETAYAAVLKSEGSPFEDRALYMQGWSIFKQGRLEDALPSFFGVLDHHVTAVPDGDDLATTHALSRADRELVEDTFRVTSLSLENLKGAESIPPYMTTDTRRMYEYRVYEQLAALYVKQERVKDAADTYAAFAKARPLHPQAPVMQAHVIDLYQSTGFDTLALAAKKEYVTQYGGDNEFRKAAPEAWANARPRVKTTLDEMTRRYHAAAQKSKSPADVDEAVHWYRAYLAAFPAEPETAAHDFLLAELLFENGRYAEAGIEYEKTAYTLPPFEHSADAGYSALLANREQEKLAAAEARPALQKAGVESALRFAGKFPKDPRTGQVLAHAAEVLYALNDGPRASTVAKQVLDLQPPAGAAQRRVAWTVIGHTAFERQAFDESEKAYREVLALVPANDPARNDLTERLAASIYKQGEQARAAGHDREAATTFARVADAAPDSTVRATAEYDAAAELIVLKDWPAAASMLEDFRRRFPNHALQAQVPAKLAVAYEEQQKWPQAAAEYERIADSKDPALARAALWQSASLYEKAGNRPAATRLYERFAKTFPQPLEQALEARAHLVALAEADGNAPRALALQREIFAADQAGGAQRTPRTRTLGAQASLAIAVPVFEAYRQVKLVEPLQKNLKLKKARMDDVLKAYAVASDYGVAEVTTAATYQVAALYQDFGKAMLQSERPKKLSKLEREQYDVLLEEQAYPFEEKAIALHEINVQRASQGIYDDWVKKSYAALRELRPVRYGKNETSEAAIDAIR
jgi:TolA-binding protein